MNFLKSTFWRSFFPLFIPLALILSLITFLLVNRIVESRRADYLRVEQANITIAATIALSHIQFALLDIRLIQAEPSLQQYLNEPDETKVTALTSNLFAMSKAKQIYDQIRFLSEDGMEISRIDGSGENSAIVPQKKLQHKGHRYYVAEAKTLGRQEVYISPLDLNMENGRVEVPYKPIIRFAMLVLDREGKRQGIILLNYLASKMLDQLNAIMAAGNGEFLFLNESGDYLVAPDKADEWGFMFDHPSTFRQRHPRVWDYINQHEKGTFTDAGNTYLFQAVYPRWHLNKLINASTSSHDFSDTPPKKFDSMRWLIVSRISKEKRQALLYREIGTPLIIYAILFVLLTIGCLFIVKGRTSTKEEEEKIRAITTSARDAVIMMDNHGNVSFWNQAAEKIFGYNPSEILGEDLHALLAPPGYHQEFADAFPEFLKRGQGNIVDKTVEISGLHKNGSTFPAELSVSAVYINNGWHAVALIRDISDRKEAEKHLRKLSLAVEESPVSIMITDKNGVIEYVNPKFCASSQYSSSEVIGQNPRLLKSGKQSDDFYEKLWSSLTADREWHGEICNRKKDGSLFWERLSISPLRNENKEISHFVAVKEDISKERDVVAALQTAKDAAEQASRAKGDFVANMSHEIRTPLNAIMGFTALALEEQMSGTLKDYISKIHQSARSLLTVINDILDYSKIDAGELTITPRDFHLNTVLDHLASLFNVQIQQKDIELIFNTDKNVPSYLHCDDNRLLQILTKLVSNAIKFTEKGEIKIRISRTAQQPMRLLFTVSDTGSGIAQDRIQDLFIAFEQLDPSVNRQYGGTGIGLTICKQLVNLMGGDIQVQSKLNQGSVFSFSLPCREVKETSPRRRVTPTEVVGMKVLAVDDNEQARTILFEQLKFLKFRPHVAESGKEALELLDADTADDPFRMIFMDWQMPDLDGLATSALIKNNPATANIPILLVSGGSPAEVADQVKGRVDGIVSKPVTMSFLFDAIMNILGKTQHTGDGTTRRQDLSLSPLPMNKLRGSRVLLVEDNLINREVATMILEKRGCFPTPAANGKEGVKIFSGVLESDTEQPFDVILMDLQMPVMDGIQATKAIRILEKKKSLSPTPIIAMTGKALAEDKAEYLACGMDDFISKPINRTELLQVLSKFISTSSEPEPVIPAPEADDSNLPATLAGFDIQDGLTRMEGNSELLRELLVLFREEYKDSGDTLEELVNRGDLAAAEKIAHILCSAAGNIGGVEISAHARELETTLQNRSGYTPSLIQFQKKLQLSMKDLKQVRKPETTSAHRIQSNRPPIKRDQLIQAFTELSELLGSNSFQAGEQMMRIKEANVVQDPDHQFQQFEHYVLSYNFQKALELLPDLQARLCQPEKWK